MLTTNDIEQLFHAHYPSMYRLAMQILRDDNAARDIVHDVFEALIVSRQPRATGAYLMTAVRNRCLNHLRALSTRQRIKNLYVLDEQKINDDDWPDDEIIARIHSTVANDLTDACRRVVQLRFTDGLSYKEIASALSISEVAVYKHLRHAIDVLRSNLSRNG